MYLLLKVKNWQTDVFGFRKVGNWQFADIPCDVIWYLVNTYVGRYTLVRFDSSCCNMRLMKAVRVNESR